jgi:hypothetical protein
VAVVEVVTALHKLELQVLQIQVQAAVVQIMDSMLVLVVQVL